MAYRLCIDDKRFPDQGWVVARTSAAAVSIVARYGMPQEIAFDHDLGEGDSVILFIRWLGEELAAKTLNFPVDFKYSVHSQNPVGAENIKAWMNSLITHYSTV